jgi:outer membrane protein OmpA-like peptidoglycan-associated protein
MLCLLAGAGSAVIGCAAQAELTSKMETPPPPPPPPPPDQDGDGINDPDDKCPTDKEDGLPPDPKDGCPTTDADKDGIPTPTDKCPNEPETVNGFEDEDGCPDTKPIAQVVGNEVKISEKIMFKKGEATIEPESMKVVKAVADVLTKNPNVQVVEVGGHASKEGDKTQNLALTQKRVDSVVAELVKLGVDKNRVMAQGYGIFCPVDEGTTEEALEKNRRVEFKILQLDGKSTDIKRGCENAVKNKVKMKAFNPTKPDAAKAGAPKADAGKGLAEKPAVKAAAPAAKPAAAPAAPKK